MFINIFLGCLARLMNKIEGGNFSEVTVDDLPFVFVLYPAVTCCQANHFTKMKYHRAKHTTIQQYICGLLTP